MQSHSHTHTTHTNCVVLVSSAVASDVEIQTTSAQNLVIRATAALNSLPKCVGQSRNVESTQTGRTSYTWSMCVGEQEKYK